MVLDLYTIDVMHRMKLMCFGRGCVLQIKALYWFTIALRFLRAMLVIFNTITWKD